MITKTGNAKLIALGLGSALAIPAGAALAYNAVKSGDLTGRETLYHGTSDAAGQSILRNGLMPTTPENGIRVNEIPDEAIRNDSYGKAYTTTNHHMARNYAMQTEQRYNPGSESEGTIVTMNVPTWKMTVSRDRFHDLDPANLRRIMKMDADTSEDEVLRRASRSNSAIRVIEGGVPAEYMPDSESYVPNSVSEIKEYVKENPTRFTLGAGKLLAGAGLLGAGGYGMKNVITKLRVL